MAFPDLTALREFAGWKAARAPEAPGPGADPESLRLAYLGLLKLALCDLAGTRTASVSRLLDGSVASRELSGEDRQLRSAGLDWPLHGLTMVGLNRLDDLQACVESVVRDEVPGDLIEAGAWRGGASILMRATLDSLGETGRTVHVADSFQGFPAADELGDLNAIDFLAVPEEEVRAAFARFGLERGVRLVPGFFEQTLPALAGTRWAVVRLDGDTYEATRTALEALYPGLATGGYLIVDDYGVMERQECRRAVDEFRARHGIEDPLEPVDWTCVRWRRTDDAPIEPAAPPTPAPARAEAMPRPREPHVPTGRELELEREVAALRAQLADRSWRRRLTR
jgi:O-methyltransferase